MSNQLITHRLPMDVIDYRLVMSGMLATSVSPTGLVAFMSRIERKYLFN